MERELLLLGLLRQEERHGYELHEFIEQTMQACVDLKKSTAYYLLDKLASQGYISESEEQAGNRPPRKVYRLTTSGETFYQDLLRENLRTYTPARFVDLIGLSFLDDISANEALALLSERREAIHQALLVTQAAPRHTGSHQLMIDHQTAHLQAELNWLDGVILHLK